MAVLLVGILQNKNSRQEYVAGGEAGKEALYLRRLLEPILFGCKGSIILFRDSKSTINLSEGSSAHCRMQHIWIR